MPTLPAATEAADAQTLLAPIQRQSIRLKRGKQRQQEQQKKSDGKEEKGGLAAFCHLTKHTADNALTASLLVWRLPLLLLLPPTTTAVQDDDELPLCGFGGTAPVTPPVAMCGVFFSPDDAHRSSEVARQLQPSRQAVFRG